MQSWQPDDLLADRYQINQIMRRSATAYLYRVSDVFRQSEELLMGPGRRLLQHPAGTDWFEQYCKEVLGIPAHRNILAPTRLDHHDGIPFLILPHIDGQFWDEAIKEGDMTHLGMMLDVSAQVARGVGWLHEHGQVHYNVKPANVLITDSGAAKVLKYGEAGAVSRVYASPEQLEGEALLTRATDVWSWATSVLHMFVGRVVWRSGLKAPAILQRYIQTGPARPGVPLMPGRLAKVLAECFRREPAERPAKMDDVAGQVQQLGESVSEGEDAGPAEPEEVFGEELAADWDILESMAEPETGAEQPWEEQPADEDEEEEAREERSRADTRRWRFRST
jgi:serine/threonine protein kinase